MIDDHALTFTGTTTSTLSTELKQFSLELGQLCLEHTQMQSGSLVLLGFSHLRGRRAETKKNF
jgi:hypothetical protein